MPYFFRLLALLLIFTATWGADTSTREARGQLCLTTVASRSTSGSDAKLDLPTYLARVLTNSEPGGVTLDQTKLRIKYCLMEGATGTLGTVVDQFDFHSIVHAWLLIGDQLDPTWYSYVQTTATRWDFSKRAGTSLNFELMQDAAGFLMAERWPEMTDKAAQNATQIKAACRARLVSRLDEIVTRNLTEYGSPVYYGTDLPPIRMLAEFSQDAGLKTRAKMTLDWIAYDLAAHYEEGLYISSAARSKGWQYIIGTNLTAWHAWLLFGGPRTPSFNTNVLTMWMAYPREWEPPRLSAEIARDRTRPAVVRSATSMPGNVQLYAYLAKGWGLASQCEQGTPPTAGLYKEMRRTVLHWDSNSGEACFTLSQENPQAGATFCYGENPYHRVIQNNGALIGLWDVPTSSVYYAVHAPFNTRGAILSRVERNGWVFCHGGSVLFAYRPLVAATWATTPAVVGIAQLDCNTRRGGWILECATPSEFPGTTSESLSAFMDVVDVAGRISYYDPVDSGGTGAVQLQYTTRDGHSLYVSYDGNANTTTRMIDGTAWSSAYPLFEHPFLTQAHYGRLLRGVYGNTVVRNDFSAWATTWAGVTVPALTTVTADGLGHAVTPVLAGYATTASVTYQPYTSDPEAGGTASGDASATPPSTAGWYRVTATLGGGDTDVRSLGRLAISTPANTAPTVATSASAPATVPGTTAALTVLGADDGGEAALTYTWSTTGTPPATVTFSANASHAAQATTATFTAAGAYSFQVVLSDASGLTATSTVNVTVTQAPTTISVSPVSGSVVVGNLQSFAATVQDQFGATITSAPVWSISGGGSIASDGTFTAGGTVGGPFTVTATQGSCQGTASVQVVATGGGNTAPTVATAASATLDTVSGTTAALTVLGADDGGEAALTYTWSTTGTPPAAVLFSANGNHAAQTTSATFVAAGTYQFQVAISDAAGLTVTSAASVTVEAHAMAVDVTPAVASVTVLGTQAFTASVLDQFDQPLAASPTWSVTGGGAIDAASGLFTAGATVAGPVTVSAMVSTVTGTASLSVIAAVPRTGDGAAASAGAAGAGCGLGGGLAVLAGLGLSRWRRRR